MSQSCAYCGNSRDNFEYDVTQKLYYCGNCGRAANYEQDRTTGFRNFGDEKSKQRDTSGSSAGKPEAQEARIFGALCEVVGALGLDPSLIQAGMCVFADYQASVRATGKTLRARSTVVVAAAAVYAASELRALAQIKQAQEAQLEFNDEKKNSTALQFTKSFHQFEQNINDTLENLMERLSEFCLGRGRGKDPFNKQLEDVRKNVVLKAEETIEDLIRRNKQRLAWPDMAGNAANRLARGLEAQRIKAVQDQQILSNGNFSWIIFATLMLPAAADTRRSGINGQSSGVLPGYHQQDWEKLVKESGLGSDFLRQQAEALRDAKPALHREVLQALHAAEVEARDAVY